MSDPHIPFTFKPSSHHIGATPLRLTFWFIAWTIVFSLAYGQAPLYYSNQNQYFLHGLAEGGYGLLRGDWLAQTADSTPVFSLLVATTYRFFHPALFYVYYALIQGIYLASLAGLFAFLARRFPSPLGGEGLGVRGEGRLMLIFQVSIIFTHSAILRWTSYHLLGQDYPWYLQAGVAGQYILGAMFQPSVFGILLVLSLCLFVHGRPLLAGGAACLAGIVHATYLVGAAMLILAYLCVLLWRGHRRQALLLGGGAFLLVLPVIVYNLYTFAPTSPDLFAQAQHILVQDRLPHHCLPRLWCDGVALGQIAWVVLALALVWGTVLFPLLGLVFLLTAGLTLLQIATGSDSLALLFPWRTSSFLVPIATAVIVGRLVLWLDRPATVWLGRCTAAGLVGAGAAIMFFRLGFVSNPDEAAMLRFVHDHKKPGDVFLIPVRVPNLIAETHGSPNGDFKPVTAKKADARLIPLDLQRFRLPTGAPIFVDFKSIPYRDTEVIEWWDRLQRNRRYYEYLASGRLAEVYDDLRRDGITHIVITADKSVAGAALVYEDPYYRVYRLPPLAA